MADEIEITVGDVNDVEAYVYARYVPSDEARKSEVAEIRIRGTLRGPFCEAAHTLPADVRFREAGGSAGSSAVAVVPDPCVWSPELPHVYCAEIEAVKGEQVIAKYRGMIGLRKAGAFSDQGDGGVP